jgi:hypothetical protein
MVYDLEAIFLQLQGINPWGEADSDVKGECLSTTRAHRRLHCADAPGGDVDGEDDRREGVLVACRLKPCLLKYEYSVPTEPLPPLILEDGVLLTRHPRPIVLVSETMYAYVCVCVCACA